ncbi:hypothetical protein RFI_09079, partial [Reticulomyxa filosa]
LIKKCENLICAYMGYNNMIEARDLAKDFEKTMRTDPNHMFYKHMIPDTQDVLRKETVKIKKIAELGPNNADVHGFLGVLYQRQGKFDSALDEFEKAIKLSTPIGVLNKKNIKAGDSVEENNANTVLNSKWLKVSALNKGINKIRHEEAKLEMTFKLIDDYKYNALDKINIKKFLKADSEGTHSYTPIFEQDLYQLLTVEPILNEFIELEDQKDSASCFDADIINWLNDFKTLIQDPIFVNLKNDLKFNSYDDYISIHNYLKGFKNNIQEFYTIYNHILNAQDEISSTMNDYKDIESQKIYYTSLREKFEALLGIKAKYFSIAKEEDIGVGIFMTEIHKKFQDFVATLIDQAKRECFEEGINQLREAADCRIEGIVADVRLNYAEKCNNITNKANIVIDNCNSIFFMKTINDALMEESIINASTIRAKIVDDETSSFMICSEARWRKLSIDAEEMIALENFGYILIDWGFMDWFGSNEFEVANLKSAGSKTLYQKLFSKRPYAIGKMISLDDPIHNNDDLLAYALAFGWTAARIRKAAMEEDTKECEALLNGSIDTPKQQEAYKLKFGESALRHRIVKQWEEEHVDSMIAIKKLAEMNRAKFLETTYQDVVNFRETETLNLQKSISEKIGAVVTDNSLASSIWNVATNVASAVYVLGSAATSAMSTLVTSAGVGLVENNGSEVANFKTSGSKPLHQSIYNDRDARSYKLTFETRKEKTAMERSIEEYNAMTYHPIDTKEQREAYALKYGKVALHYRIEAESRAKRDNTPIDTEEQQEAYALKFGKAALHFKIQADKSKLREPTDQDGIDFREKMKLNSVESASTSESKTMYEQVLPKKTCVPVEMIRVDMPLHNDRDIKVYTTALGETAARIRKAAMEGNTKEYEAMLNDPVDIREQREAYSSKFGIPALMSRIKAQLDDDYYNSVNGKKDQAYQNVINLHKTGKLNPGESVSKEFDEIATDNPLDSPLVSHIETYVDALLGSCSLEFFQ